MQIVTKEKDIMWNYVGTFFRMGMGYLMLPCLLLYLDEDTLGVWYIFMSISGIATLFDFGFSPSFARNIAYCYGGAKQLRKTGKEIQDYKSNSETEVDWNLFKTILCTCKILYLGIAIVVLLLLVTIGTQYIIYVVGDKLDNKIWFSWIVFVIAIFFNLFWGYCSSFLMGVGAVKESNKALIIASVFRIFVMYLMMILGSGILGACIAYLCYGFLYRQLCYFYFKKKVPPNVFEYSHIRYIKKEIWECFSQVWHNAWRDGFVSLSDYLVNQAGTIVCSLMFSLSETAAYSLSMQLVVCIGKMARSLHNAHMPELQVAYITNDVERSRKIQSKCIVGFEIVYIFGILILMTIGIPVIGTVLNAQLLSWPYLLGISIYEFVLVLRNCYFAYLSSTNRLIYWKSAICSGCVFIFLSVFLIKFMKLNIAAMIISAIISELIYNFWKWPRMVKNELDLTERMVWKIGIKELIVLGRGVIDEKNCN